MDLRSEKLTAIILAGGRSTRMGATCGDVPKAMLEFSGHPFLYYLVSWLVRAGVGEVLLSTGQLSERIESEFAAEPWLSRGVKIVREEAPLGTGGAVRFTAVRSSNENIFLCNGDTAVSLDLPHLYEEHGTIGTGVTAILTLARGAPNQGAVAAEGGIVTEFREGGEPREIVDGEIIFRGSSTGCYFVRRSSVLATFPDGPSSLEREVLPALAAARLLGAVNGGSGFFVDFGTPERLALLRERASALRDIYGDPMSTKYKEGEQNA